MGCRDTYYSDAELEAHERQRKAVHFALDNGFKYHKDSDWVCTHCGCVVVFKFIPLHSGKCNK